MTDGGGEGVMSAERRCVFYGGLAGRGGEVGSYLGKRIVRRTIGRGKKKKMLKKPGRRGRLLRENKGNVSWSMLKRPGKSLRMCKGRSALERL